MGSPTTTPIIERRHAWGFLVLDIQDGAYSRDVVIIQAGSGVCTAGLVLGKVTHALVATAAALGANIGNPTFSAIGVGDPAVVGAYELQMADATHFVVESPAGAEIGHGQLGQPFAAGGLSFTATAGGTACVAGDSFTLTVAAGSGKYAPFDPTAQDGREVACAILGNEYIDATTADKRAGALVRGPSKVNASELVWGANVTTPQQQAAALAQLQAVGILNVGGIGSI